MVLVRKAAIYRENTAIQIHLHRPCQSLQNGTHIPMFLQAVKVCSYISKGNIQQTAVCVLQAAVYITDTKPVLQGYSLSEHPDADTSIQPHRFRVFCQESDQGYVNRFLLYSRNIAGSQINAFIFFRTDCSGNNGKQYMISMYQRHFRRRT